MNRTNVEHMTVAIILQLVIAAITYNLYYGALFASGLFLGREHAQREYHIGDPSKLVGYEALDFWNWSLDAKLDLLLPVLGVTAVCLINYIWGVI